MPASVAIPAVRQKRSKLAPTCCQASSTIADGKPPAGVIDFSMALLSFSDSAPRAYRVEAGDPYLTFSTTTGTSPDEVTNVKRKLLYRRRMVPQTPSMPCDVLQF